MIGIIGGSGLGDPKILKNPQEKLIDTPYGKVNVQLGTIKDVPVALIARHGRQHTIPPTQVNNRGYIAALKKLGCTHILASTAVGSLRKDIERGHLVILDQFIDFTKHRINTFIDDFKPHQPDHPPMADPFSEELRTILINSAEKNKLNHHKKGTVVTIEGPRFSTRAESRMFRIWGADVINMSIAPEVALANEAKIPYAAVAMSTDYDCLFDDVPPVTWEEVLAVFNENVEKVTTLLIDAIPQIGKGS